MGQSFRHSPKEFKLISERFKHRLVQFGYAESREEYLQWLRSADAFLSTALHEFQGLSVLEAVACGCTPVLPAREVYPALFAEQYLYNCAEDIDQEATAACNKLSEAATERDTRMPPDVSYISWNNQRGAYEDMLNSITAKN